MDACKNEQIDGNLFLCYDLCIFIMKMQKKSTMYFEWNFGRQRICIFSYAAER